MCLPRESSVDRSFDQNGTLIKPEEVDTSEQFPYTVISSLVSAPEPQAIDQFLPSSLLLFVSRIIIQVNQSEIDLRY